MSLPEGCFSYLEVLDEEYWSLVARQPDTESVALRDEYRATRQLEDDAIRKQEAEAQYRSAILLRLHQAKRSALCFSGGGIRSATFGLGVLQGLAQRSVHADRKTALVTEFDYLSTVSGGGYLGSWFSAWASRVGGPASVVEQLATPPATTFEPEPKPVQHLRRFSSYLSPRLGALSSDTWTLAGTVLRNMFLNWLVLIPFLAAVLLIPLLFYQLARVPAGPVGETTLTFLLVSGFLAGVVGTGYVGYDLPSSGNARLGANRYLVFCLGALMLSAIHLNAFWAWWPADGIATRWLHLIREGKNSIDLRHFMLFGAVMHGGGMLAGAVVAWVHFQKPPLRRGLEATMVAALTGAVGGAVGFAVTRVFPPDASIGWIGDAKLYTCAAFPLVMSVFLLSGALLVGGTSNITQDEDREWWARSGGWLLLPTVVWPIAAACILYAGPWLDALEQEVATVAATVGVGGITAWLGFLPKTSSAREGDMSDASAGVTGRVSALASKLILPAFLLLLTMALSHLNVALLRVVHLNMSSFPGPILLRETAPVWIMIAAFLAISAGASWPINVNKFSLHAMYRLRLIRAYLGASNPHRDPHPFTGFDKNDDIPMCRLSASKPLHIVNITLNLVKGENLAWQQRKAAPFTSTRLHTGSCRLGYRPSEVYGGEEGITLGTAVTISGAAASPNMGYNSSTLLTIVMMLFNARLGSWLGNPKDTGRSWAKSGPTFGIRPFLDEMFGMTDDTNSWLYLSDGGHFENLGLYEAVLRRCHTIVVSDAGCDPRFVFDDLGNAVRKINIDLGIPIVFTATESPCGTRHWTTGRIRYSVVDGPGVPDGVLVYIKPTLTGDEPADVRQYAAANPSFPHQTTADQFFEEPQFESYRRLGLHIVESVCGDCEPLTLNEFVERAERGPANRSAARA